MKKKLISSREFILQLIDLGIIPSRSTEVHIDAAIDEAVTIRAAYYSEDNLQEIKWFEEELEGKTTSSK